MEPHDFHQLASQLATSQLGTIKHWHDLRLFPHERTGEGLGRVQLVDFGIQPQTRHDDPWDAPYAASARMRGEARSAIMDDCALLGNNPCSVTCAVTEKQPVSSLVSDRMLVSL